jgi:hypothetical protein
MPMLFEMQNEENTKTPCNAVYAMRHEMQQFPKREHENAYNTTLCECLNAVLLLKQWRYHHSTTTFSTISISLSFAIVIALMTSGAPRHPWPFSTSNA